MVPVFFFSALHFQSSITMSTLFRARSLIPWRGSLTLPKRQTPFTVHQGVTTNPLLLLLQTKIIQERRTLRHLTTSACSQSPLPPPLPITTPVPNPVAPEKHKDGPHHHHSEPGEETKHAVVSTFDLFSIGIGPSSRWRPRGTWKLVRIGPCDHKLTVGLSLFSFPLVIAIRSDQCGQQRFSSRTWSRTMCWKRCCSFVFLYRKWHGQEETDWLILLRD